MMFLTQTLGYLVSKDLHYQNDLVLLILCLFFVPGASGIKTNGQSVFVKDGDSVTLHTDIIINQRDRMKWYFNDTRIAQIKGYLSYICTDEECDERFRGKLKLDHQTGSLTIMNFRATDSGLYKLQIISRRISQKIFNISVQASAETDNAITKSVNEGESVTLDPGVIKNPNDFNDIPIAEINGDLGDICTDDQCEERFRDRLKVKHQTGSLTIMNTRSTDSGLYKLQINSSIHRHQGIRRFSITITGVSGVETQGESVFVMEGDSVTLHTDITINRRDRMKWYFNDTRIAQIKGDFGKICTDKQCDERFRDRLKLDSHTCDLTITNIRTTDAGVYKLQSISKRISQKIFHVAVHGVPAIEQDEMKRKIVKEGESVILDPGEIKNPNYLITWHFNDDHIAEISGDQSKICTDGQCTDADERFRGRLKVNHVSGCLTIRNTRITDSGQYKLKIILSIRRRHSISIIRIRKLSVTVIDSGPSSGLIAGICAAVVVVLLVFASITFPICRSYINKMLPPLCRVRL